MMEVPESRVQLSFGRLGVGLRVTATTDFESSDAAADALRMLSVTSLTLTSRLGVSVVRVEVLAAQRVVRLAPAPPPPSAPPTPVVSFLAPSRISEDQWSLTTVRSLETIFAQAFEVPPSWLDIGVAESDEGAVGKSQAAFVMTIELKPERHSLARLATIRDVLGDEERLAHLLATAVPGATLVTSSLASLSPPRPAPLVLPPSAPSVTAEPMCTLCPAGFKCPEGSKQPVACEEGTEQPRVGEAECVAVSASVEAGATSVEPEEKDSLEASSNVQVVAEFTTVWVPVIAGCSAAALLCLLGIALCAWRLARRRKLTLSEVWYQRHHRTLKGKEEEALPTTNVLKEMSGILQLKDEESEKPSSSTAPLQAQQPRVTVQVHEEEDASFKAQQPFKARVELRRSPGSPRPTHSPAAEATRLQAEMRLKRRASAHMDSDVVSNASWSSSQPSPDVFKRAVVQAPASAGVRMEVTLDDLKKSPAMVRDAVESEIKRSGSPAGGVRVSPELLRSASPDELRGSPEAIRLAASVGSERRLTVTLPARAEGPLGLTLSDEDGPDQPPRVTDLTKDGPAASCLRMGDVVEQVNGLPVAGSNTSGAMQWLMRSGSELTFTVVRSSESEVESSRLVRPPPRSSSPLDLWKRRQQISPEPPTLSQRDSPTASPEAKRSLSPSHALPHSRTVELRKSSAVGHARLESPTDSAYSSNTPSVTPSATPSAKRSASNWSKRPSSEGSSDDGKEGSSDDGKTFFSLTSMAESDEQTNPSDAPPLSAPTPRRRSSSGSLDSADDGGSAIRRDGDLLSPGGTLNAQEVRLMARLGQVLASHTEEASGTNGGDPSSTQLDSAVDTAPAAAPPAPPPMVSTVARKAKPSTSLWAAVRKSMEEDKLKTMGAGVADPAVP